MVGLLWFWIDLCVCCFCVVFQLLHQCFSILVHAFLSFSILVYAFQCFVNALSMLCQCFFYCLFSFPLLFPCFSLICQWFVLLFYVFAMLFNNLSMIDPWSFSAMICLSFVILVLWLFHVVRFWILVCFYVSLPNDLYMLFNELSMLFYAFPMLLNALSILVQCFFNCLSTLVFAFQ